MTIVENTCAISGGVDTHAGMHVAAALWRIVIVRLGPDPATRLH